MNFLKNKAIVLGLLTCLLMVSAAGGLAFFSRLNRSQAQASQPGQVAEATAPEHEVNADDEEHISVKTVNPKSNPAFRLNVRQPAYVEPYYQAPLLARVAGPIKFIRKDIGDPVVKGEKLIEIDLPDLDADVAQKVQMVEQRRQEVQLAEANARMQQVGIDVALSVVKEKQSQVQVAEADRDYKKTMLDRFKVLVAKEGVMASMVDEQFKNYQVSLAARQTAEIAVATANAAVLAAKEKFAAAQADIRLKGAILKVAEEDVKRAKALLEFGTIRAPFDGVITDRSVDPGSFVQNAATAHTDPLMRVERQDIVTVYMKVPDVYAPYVTGDTEALLEMSELPGVVIKGKLTRFTPSLQTASRDRTMRVEMDLYNGSAEDYQRFVEFEKQTGNADLKARGFPILPEFLKGSKKLRRLLPGMYGTMQLTLGSFKNTLLIPSSAIVNQGGHSYIYELVDGKAELHQVNVRLDDGKVAKVVLVVTDGEERVERDLTGKEVIVISNQGELREGQAVRANHVEW